MQARGHSRAVSPRAWRSSRLGGSNLPPRQACWLAQGTAQQPPPEGVALFGSAIATGSWEGAETAPTPPRKQYCLGVWVGEGRNCPDFTPTSLRKKKTQRRQGAKTRRRGRESERSCLIAPRPDGGTRGVRENQGRTWRERGRSLTPAATSLRLCVFAPWR